MNKGLKLKKEGGIEPRTVRFLNTQLCLIIKGIDISTKINAQLPQSTVTCGPGALRPSSPAVTQAAYQCLELSPSSLEERKARTLLSRCLMDAGNSKQTALLLNGPPLILLPFRNQFSSKL